MESNTIIKLKVATATVKYCKVPPTNITETDVMGITSIYM
jgi:hypothetical protein